MMYMNMDDKPKRYKREYNVYRIVNDVDEKVYIGSTTTELWHRMSQHRADARKGEKSPLYEHMRKIGVEHVKIERICTSDELHIKEVEEMTINSTPKEIRLNFKCTSKRDTSKKYNYDEIVEVYKKVGSINKTSNIIGCSRVTVKKAIRKLLLDL